MSTYQFHNRKPSKTQINACIKNAIKDNSKTIGIEWGENAIDLQYFEESKQWGGRGWIGKIGGQDIAESLNRKQFINTMNLWNS